MTTDPLSNGSPDAFPHAGARRARVFWSTLLKAMGALAIIGFCTLLFFPTLIATISRPYYRATAKRLPPPLGTYPDFEALGRVARAQLAGTTPQMPTVFAQPPRPRGATNPPLLVWVSRSGSGGTGQWDSLQISPTGAYRTESNSWNYAVKGGGTPKPPQPVDPKALQALADRLGPSASPPPLGQVLIVSFWRGGGWTTRLYDRSAPPAPLVEIERRVAQRSMNLWLER